MLTFERLLLKILNQDLFIKDTHREKKHHQIKLQSLKKYEYGHLGHSYIKSTLYKRFLG